MQQCNALKNEINGASAPQGHGTLYDITLTRLMRPQPQHSLDTTDSCLLRLLTSALGKSRMSGSRRRCPLLPCGSPWRRKAVTGDT